MFSDPMAAYKEDKFTKTEFSSWKNASANFEKHESTLANQQSSDLVKEIPVTNVGHMLREKNTVPKSTLTGKY